jgi:hypothetical protein
MALNLVQPTLGMNTDNVAMAGLEKVLKAIASGNTAGAAKMFRDLLRQGARNRKLLDEYAANRRKQRERAKKLREDELDGVIREIVKRRLNISESDLCADLDRMARDGHEVIQNLDDHYIYVTRRKGGERKKIKRSGLPSRLSRMKRKIRKSELR